MRKRGFIVSKGGRNEPDFLGQREWLREVVENSGHRIMYFPKFHCELNYIEMVWAYVKAKLRRLCIFSIHALRESLPVELEWVSTRIGWLTIGLHTEKV